jgi:hypothetical protein
MADKKRVYVLSGGPNDLGELYLISLKDVQSTIDSDLDGVSDEEIKEVEYTLTVTLMTQKEIDDLPEYEY